VERVLFGSDCPMDATAGVAFTSDAIRSVKGLQVTEAERALIFRGNATRVLKTG
jgi:predicted TIM-barrel fold metal-dependent hydrolase